MPCGPPRRSGRASPLPARRRAPLPLLLHMRSGRRATSQPVETLARHGHASVPAQPAALSQRDVGRATTARRLRGRRPGRRRNTRPPTAYVRAASPAWLRCDPRFRGPPRARRPAVPQAGPHHCALWKGVGRTPWQVHIDQRDSALRVSAIGSHVACDGSPSPSGIERPLLIPRGPPSFSHPAGDRSPLPRSLRDGDYSA